VTLQPRMVEVRQKVLKQNDLLARELRQRFKDNGVFVVSLVSSPGSGKTAFPWDVLSRQNPPPRDIAMAFIAARIDTTQKPLGSPSSILQPLSNGRFRENESAPNSFEIWIRSSIRSRRIAC